MEIDLQGQKLWDTIYLWPFDFDLGNMTLVLNAENEKNMHL